MPVFGHFLATFWPFLATFWPLLGRFWPLFGHFLATFRPFFGHLFRPFLGHYLGRFINRLTLPSMIQLMDVCLTVRHVVVRSPPMNVTSARHSLLGFHFILATPEWESTGLRTTPEPSWPFGSVRPARPALGAVLPSPPCPQPASLRHYGLASGQPARWGLGSAPCRTPRLRSTARAAPLRLGGEELRRSCSPLTRGQEH